jgi:hypothetical protein
VKGVLVQVRERGRAAALLLGALAALVVGPAAFAGSQARSPAAAGSSAGLVRPATVPHPATRARIDHPLTATRSVRAQAATSASRAGSHPRQSLPGAAVLPTAVVVAALVLTGLAGARHDRRAPRRTPMGIRGRAPPALALA